MRSVILCVCTIISEVPAASFNAFFPDSTPPSHRHTHRHCVLMSAPSFPSAANSFRADIDKSSFRNFGSYVLHIRCYISDNSVIGRSVVQFFSDPMELQFHLVPPSKQTAVSVWHMPVAVCTVLNSWWWKERQPETCRVSFQNKFDTLVHLVGLAIGIYYDARPYECQMHFKDAQYVL